MAIFGFVRVRLAVRSRDAMYVHDIPQIGPVNVARIASIMGLAPKHGYDHRQTAATLLSLAAKGDHMFVIPGAHHPETILDSLKADQLELTPEELAKLG